jgi:hypothetical protein
MHPNKNTVASSDKMDVFEYLTYLRMPCKVPATSLQTLDNPMSFLSLSHQVSKHNRTERS